MQASKSSSKQALALGSSLWYGPRLSQDPVSTLCKGNDTRISAIANSSNVAREPHYGIFAMGVDPSNARRTGQINST